MALFSFFWGPSLIVARDSRNGALWQKHCLWGRTHLHSPYKGVPPPPPGNDTANTCNNSNVVDAKRGKMSASASRLVLVFASDRMTKWLEFFTPVT